MQSNMLSAASALFAVGAVLSFDKWKRERAHKLTGGSIGESRAASAINSVGNRERVDRIVIESRPGRVASIDHVVRGRRRLLVVETKNWNGVIHGRRRERDWLQVRPNGDKVPQRNPVMQAKRQAKVLSEAVGVPVAHLVVMAGRSRHHEDAFPPEVVTLGALGASLTELLDGEHLVGEADPQALEAAWRTLSALAAAPDAENRANKHGDELETRYGNQGWIGWMAMAIAYCAAAAAMAMNGE